MIPGRNTFLLSWGVLFFGQMLFCRALAGDVTVTIDRKYSGASCTSGYIEIDGKIIAYTVELPWNGNKPLISSIPVGSYYGFLRYDKSDRWRIQLEGVPNRSGVQIHTGNTTDDTEGCILIGTGLNSDLCSLSAGTSRPAYAAFKKAFYGSANPVETPVKRIVVKVEEKATAANSDDRAHQQDQFEGEWVVSGAIPKNEFGDQMAIRATGTLNETHATFVNEVTFTAGEDRRVKGCSNDVITGRYIDKREYNVKFDQEKKQLLLSPVGTATISAVDPPCWTPQTFATANVRLFWDGKILSDELGEDYRRVKSMK